MLTQGKVIHRLLLHSSFSYSPMALGGVYVSQTRAHTHTHACTHTNRHLASRAMDVRCCCHISFTPFAL